MSYPETPEGKQIRITTISFKYRGENWIHNKTGDLYFLIGNIPDCTNSENNKRMALYMNLEGRTFTREMKEFSEKFTIVYEDIPKKKRRKKATDNG